MKGIEEINAEELERYVWIRADGRLVVELTLRKRMGNHERRLISCVEDNIVEKNGQEIIDYEGAIRDFYA